jgi:hypothetical protein
MAGDDPLPTDPVAAAFRRLAATTQVRLEAQHQPAGTRLLWWLGAVCNGALVLGMLLAIAVSTYALLVL